MSASIGQISAWMEELEAKMLDNFEAANELKWELRQAEWYLREGSELFSDFNRERIEVEEEVRLLHAELAELEWKYDSYIQTWDRLDSLYQDYMEEQA